MSHMMDSPWLVPLSCSFRNASTSYEITRLGAVIDLIPEVELGRLWSSCDPAANNRRVSFYDSEIALV